MAVRSVLAIGAHPDDLELLCAGTLARYSKQGVKVFMCNATDGSKGGMGRDVEEIRKVRRQEAAESARVIDAHYIAGPFRDGELEVNLDSRRTIIDIIRQCSPDVVLAHHPNDYHPDHTAVSRLVIDAIYQVAIPHFRTDHPALNAVPLLYFFDTASGVGFEPEEYVDITDVIDIKKKMLTAHASQIGFIREHHGEDLVEKVEITGRYRGYQCNAKYAECFVASQSWPRGTTHRVLP